MALIFGKGDEVIKRAPTMNCVFLAFGIALLFSSLLLLALFFTYQSFRARFERNQTYKEIGEDIRSRVAIGDEREKVLQAMKDSGAWYSIKCSENEKDTVYDYFYFGGKERDNVFVFVLTSYYRDNQYVHGTISNFSDSVSINDISIDCLPPELK